MADRAGAVAIAREVEKALATFPVVYDMKEGTEGEERGEEKSAAAGGRGSGSVAASRSGAEANKVEKSGVAKPPAAS